MKTLSTQAARAVTYANAAASRHRASKQMRRKAQKLVALAMIYELRREGKRVARKTERAIRN